MNNGEEILRGLKVIDFGQYIAGPLASMILADFGAEVIHIDPPCGPMMKDNINAAFMRGKKSQTLDLKNEGDLAKAQELIAGADVVIENFRPGVMERLGIGPQAMTDKNQKLIYCSMPGFGSDDEERRNLPGWEGIVMAEAGMYRVGRFPLDKDTPIFYSLYVASVFAALTAVHSILAALIVRERTGEGQRIEEPLYDACFEAAGYFGGGKPAAPFPQMDPRMNLSLLEGFQTKDGRHVQFSPPLRGLVKFWDYLLDGKEFPGMTDEIRELVTEKFKEHTMEEWEEIGQEKLMTGISVILSSKEWLHDKFALESGSVCKIDDSELGETFQPGRIAIIGTACEKADSTEKADKETIHHALEGMKVLDLCQILAGPTCGRILAEYGADVIKINNPRFMENPIAIAGHESVNNGKATTFLDLKDEKDRELFKELLKETDIFHCNFSSEAMAKLGLTEEDIREIAPEVIYSRLNVHSFGGKKGDYRGHEELGEAMTGMTMRMAGNDIGSALPITFCDNATGSASAIGVLLAVYNKLKTGKGISTQAALSRTASYLQFPYMIDYDGKEWNEPAGAVWGWSPYNRLYKTAEGWVYLFCRNGAGDLRNIKGFRELPEDSASFMESAMMAKNADEWVEFFKGTDVTVRKNRAFCADSMAEPYAVRKGLSLTGEHRGYGEIRTIGCGPRLSKTPAKIPFLAAEAGLDTEAIKEKKWDFFQKS